MQFLRILGVWLIALSLVSLLFGGGKGFLFVFLIYGMFMTLPALAVLATASLIEGVLIRRSHPVAALALGPVIGLVVPALLFLIAPNKSNAMSAMGPMAFVTLGTGLLWALSYLWCSRGSRLQQTEEQFD